MSCITTVHCRSDVSAIVDVPCTAVAKYGQTSGYVCNSCTISSGRRERIKAILIIISFLSFNCK
jgi:hypothetical protein